jgi:PPM family protein phosphatase
MPEQFDQGIPARDPSFETIEFGVASIPSESHPNTNQDSFLADHAQGLFGVFDGVGGHTAGEIASRAARDKIREELVGLADLNEEEFKSEMEKAFIGAHEHVVRMGLEDPRYRDMGTTAVVVQLFPVSDGRLKMAVGNVGDSRAYVFRNEQLVQLTRDDSLVEATFSGRGQGLLAELIQRKKGDSLSKDALAFYNSRNMLFQDIGGLDKKYNRPTEIKPAVQIIDAVPGERVLIVSDGVSDNLLDSEMALVMREYKDPNICADTLTRAAAGRSRQETMASKKDDMTAIVFRIPG